MTTSGVSGAAAPPRLVTSAFLALAAATLGVDGADLPLAVYAIVVIGLRIVGGCWPDRLGAARLSGVALTVTAAGLAIIGLVPTPIALVAGTIVFAAGVSALLAAIGSGLLLVRRHSLAVPQPVASR